MRLMQRSDLSEGAILANVALIANAHVTLKWRSPGKRTPEGPGWIGNLRAARGF